MEPTVREAIPRAVGRSGIDLLVGIDDGTVPLGLPDPDAQIINEFFERANLGLSRKVTVEVADQTDAQRNIIEVITGDMAPVELGCPTVADLDLPVTRAMSVTDHEMIGQAVLHVAHAEVVDVEDAGIPLTGAAVVNDDVFPPSMSHRGMIDGSPGGGVQISIGMAGATAAKEPAKESSGGFRSRGGLDPLIGLGTGFLNRDRRGGIRSMGQGGW